MQRVLFLRNGGTLEATVNQNGRKAPREGGSIPKEFFLYHERQLGIEIISKMPLKDEEGKDRLEDSSESGKATWIQDAREIADHVNNHGVRKIVLGSGTDTKEYLANGLTFCLENLKELGITILLTGSEIEWDHWNTDAPRNVSNSLYAVTKLPPGVFILFGPRVLLGCRTVKFHSNSFTGFESPNYPQIAEIGGDGRLKLFDHFVSSKSSATTGVELSVFTDFSDPPFVTAVIPDSSPDILYYAFDRGYPGILLSCYGLGNMPKRWRKVVEDLSKKIPIAITTQCIQGGVKPEVYEVGAPETAISCGDITFSCSIVKLRWAIGKANGDITMVRRLMMTSIHGELSGPEDVFLSEMVNK